MFRLSVSSIYSLAAIILLSSMLSTCTSAARTSVEPTPIKSGIEREITPQVAKNTLTELVGGNSSFAFDLYQALKEEDGNLFFSPYSISAALAMTYAGAGGDTESQMAEVLHYGLHQNELHPAFNALDQTLVSPPGETDEETFTLRVANSLWGQEGFPFKEEYLNTLARNYGAGMRLVDFVDDAKREGARQAINGWVSDETQGKIEDMIPENILTALTRLVLANAIYFKGEWEQPFLNGTEDAPFTLLDGTQVQVPTMSRRASTLYAEGEDYQAMSLAYRGDEAAMLVLLPSEGQFEDFEGSLDAERVDNILGQLGGVDVKLYMPRYGFESEYSLRETLAGMGMPDAFIPEVADFTGMFEADQVDGNLFLSHVIHKAFVAVDEIGTEAAAATGVVVEVESMPQMVRVERPFIFLIYNRETNTVLFVGRVLDPR